MDPRTRALRDTFSFGATDLAANRAGRLSPRQEALLRTGHAGMRLALGVFAAVMLGSAGLVAFSARLGLGMAGDSRTDRWVAGGAASAVALAVIVPGALLSRPALRAARSRHIRVASGPARLADDDSDVPAVRIGAAPLRLAATTARQAFHPGVEYRVYYLEGPASLVLSAEVILDPTRTSLAERPDGETEGTSSAPTADPARLVRRAYPVVAGLGALALAIPLAGFLAVRLPGSVRPLAWFAMLVVAAGFVVWAVRRLSPPRP